MSNDLPHDDAATRAALYVSGALTDQQRRAFEAEASTAGEELTAEVFVTSEASPNGIATGVDLKLKEAATGNDDYDFATATAVPFLTTISSGAITVRIVAETHTSGEVRATCQVEYF